jgi:hypothetical protein
MEITRPGVWFPWTAATPRDLHAPFTVAPRTPPRMAVKRPGPLPGVRPIPRYRHMKTLALPIAGAGVMLLLAAGAVTAATPPPVAPSPAPTVAPAPTTAPAAAPAAQAPGTIAAILGLTDAEVMSLRQQGLSLAQIAERQKVDPQKLVDALAAQWSARIDARLAAGAITAEQATALKANVTVQAKAMVNQAAPGGMRGGAVGAGPNGTMRGMGGGAGARIGAARGGMMRGAGAGTGVCPMASTAPAS